MSGPADSTGNDQPMDRRQARAAARAEKARAKALRPWYRKKRWWVLGGLVVIIVVVAIASAVGDDEDEPTVAAGTETEAVDDTDTRSLELYPDRPDRQDQDHEASVGDTVRLAGYTATVTAAEITSTPLGEQLTVFVEVENRDDSAQPYNLFDWRLQDEAGRVVDPTINLRDDDLGSGDLVEGGTASGTVAFDVGAGSYYVIYKPDPFNAARGIWQVGV